MIQINDRSFNNVFKRDAMIDNEKYACGVICANSNEEALKIAKHLVKDIKNHINMKKEEEK